MAEYIDREVALKIVTDMMCDCKVTHKGRAIRRNIKQIPIADVAEVVRCKDCMWWYPHEYGSVIGRCENPYNGLTTEYIEEDDFCSYGEKKGCANNG